MKKIVFIWALSFLFIWNGSLLCAADDNWRDDFDRICAQTGSAGKLSKEELSSLIAESDGLLKIIKSSDDPEEKIYLIRLKKCRNFFIFMQGIAKSSEDN